MSTLKTVNIQHPSSASVNAGTDTSGNFLMNSGYGSAATAYGCRAWVNFNGTGTVAIRASGNVTSITDNGTGDYTVNFTNAMPDANYSVCTMSNRLTGTYNWSVVNEEGTRTTSAIQIKSNQTGTLIDMLYINVAVFR